MALRRKTALSLSLLFLLILATAANVVLYLKKHGIDMFLPATYKTLYHPLDVPVLSGTEILSKGHLRFKIAMTPEPTGWGVTDDTGESYEEAGKFPALKLKEFVHDYTLETRGLTPPVKVTIKFGFYTSEYYKKGGRTQPDNYWMVSASVPVGKFRRLPLAHWVDTFPYVSEAEKEEARGILRDEMSVAPADPAPVKIEKICAVLAALYPKGAGTPDDRMQAEISPLKIFKRFRSGEGKLWCTQMAIMYHFFANLAGVPTRLISLNGHIDKVITTGHAFAESYVPGQGGWARIDPSGNKFLTWNPENRLLNSADILHVVQNGSYADLSAKTFKEGAVATVPYPEVNASDIEYFTPGANLIYNRGRYSAGHKIVRYLFSPTLGYAFDAEYMRGIYFRRRLLFAVWAALLIAWIVSLVCLRRPKRL